MKKYEIAAIVLVVLYVISMFSNPLHAWLVSVIYSAEEYGILRIHQQVLLSVQWFLESLVAIAIAVWLGYQAQKDGRSGPGPFRIVLFRPRCYSLLCSTKPAGPFNTVQRTA